MPEDDTVTTATQDTGAATSTAPDTSAAPDTSTDTTPDASTATPDQPTGTDAPPADPTSETRSQQIPNAAETKPPVNWEERYKNLQSYADRRTKQAQAHIEQLQRQTQEYARLQTEREAQAKAKPWQSQSPQHAKFKESLTGAKTVHRQLMDLDQAPVPQGVDPAEHAARVTFAKQRIMAGLSTEEQQTLREYQAEMGDWQNKLFSEPEEAIGPIAERKAMEVFQRMQDDMRGRMQVDHDFEQPHLKPLLQDPKYAQYLKTQVDNGVPYPAAMEMFKLRAAVDLMTAKLSGANRQATHAQEQVRLAQGRAARGAQADPATAPVDPYRLALAEAQKRGIAPGTSAFNKLYDEFASRVAT